MLGKHRLEDFKDRDMILVAPSVPLDSVHLEEARKNGIPLKQSAALFYELTDIPMIGVTGTRGKSTVVQMIHHTLKIATGQGNIILGGNVRGVSNLELLAQVEEDSIAVFELDSWQLQGFGWSEASPEIAVFTNFMEDHQNYYHSMEKYFHDKAQIFLHQTDQNIFVTTPDVFRLAGEYEKDALLSQEVVLADASRLPEGIELKLPGEHNRQNAALAYEALKATSLEDELIKEGLESFEGVEGRLQFVREVQGVMIYNDNNATIPAATAAGIEALSDNDVIKNVVLIVGGSDKEMSMDRLPEVIQKHAKHVVLYSGTGTEKLKVELSDKVATEEYALLKDAVAAAMAAAESGDTILFSPAFASFNEEFKNEYDRNDQFMALVEQLP